MPYFDLRPGYKVFTEYSGQAILCSVPAPHSIALADRILLKAEAEPGPALDFKELKAQLNNRSGELNNAVPNQCLHLGVSLCKLG